MSVGGRGGVRGAVAPPFRRAREVSLGLVGSGSGDGDWRGGVCGRD
jgi:hypothetical protein